MVPSAVLTGSGEKAYLCACIDQEASSSMVRPPMSSSMSRRSWLGFRSPKSGVERSCCSLNGSESDVWRMSVSVKVLLHG